MCIYWSLIFVVLSRFSHVQLCVMLWIVARQAPLSMGFSRQEYWSGLPCPPLGDLPNPGIEPASLTSPTLAGGCLTSSTKSNFCYRWGKKSSFVRLQLHL